MAATAACRAMATTATCRAVGPFFLNVCAVSCWVGQLSVSAWPHAGCCTASGAALLAPQLHTVIAITLSEISLPWLREHRSVLHGEVTEQCTASTFGGWDLSVTVHTRSRAVSDSPLHRPPASILRSRHCAAPPTSATPRQTVAISTYHGSPSGGCIHGMIRQNVGIHTHARTQTPVLTHAFTEDGGCHAQGYELVGHANGCVERR